MIRKVFFISLVLLTGCIAPIQPVSTPLSGATQTALGVSEAAPMETETLPLPAKSLPATPTHLPSPSQAPAVELSPPIPTDTPLPQQTEPSPPPLATATPLPRLPSGAEVTLAYIQMTGLQTGWAIDTAGRILHTDSGAQTWEDVTPPEGIYWSGWSYEGVLRTPGGFFALDDVQAWAVPYIRMCFSECPAPPETATIWRTINGGQTWQPSQPFCPNWSGCDVKPGQPGFYWHELYPVGLQFIDERNGWLVGVVDHGMFQDRYGLYHTTDGGSTWEPLVTNESPNMMTFNLTGMGFINRQIGWIATSEIGGAASPEMNWQLLQTTNGGETFQASDLPTPGSLPAYFASDETWCGQVSLRVIPPRMVDVIFSCGIQPHSFYEEYFYAFHSTDGGQTWATSPASRSVYFVDAAHGWKLLAPPPPETAGIPSDTPLPPDASPTPIEAHAFSMRLQRTTDGGKTWTDLRPVTWDAAQFSFANPLDGWAVVARGGKGTDASGRQIAPEVALIQTVDGGQNWQMLKPKTK